MQAKAPISTDRALLERAHNLMSGILQRDYLSDGRGHKRLRKLDALQAKNDTNSRSGRPVANLCYPEIDGTPIPPDAEALEPDLFEEHGFAEECDEAPHDAYVGTKRVFRHLTSSEEYQLVCAARGGSEVARDKLVVHNLGLVEMIARRYWRRTTMPLDDLIAEGNFGLFEAIKRFDPEYGYRFASYAKWWVRQCIEAALMSQSRVVRLPAHVNRELRKSWSADDPTAPDARFSGCLLNNVSHVDAATGDHAEPLNILDSIPADESFSPDFALDQQKQRQCLFAALAQLSEDDRAILQARFGIGCEEPLTLHDVAKKMGRSSERIRQLQARAMQRLHLILLDIGVDAAPTHYTAI